MHVKKHIRFEAKFRFLHFYEDQPYYPKSTDNSQNRVRAAQLRLGAKKVHRASFAGDETEKQWLTQRRRGFRNGGAHVQSPSAAGL